MLCTCDARAHAHAHVRAHAYSCTERIQMSFLPSQKEVLVLLQDAVDKVRHAHYITPPYVSERQLDVFIICADVCMCVCAAWCVAALG